jgi:hypothetical protein
MNPSAKKFILITLGMAALVLIAKKLNSTTVPSKAPCTGKKLVIGDSHAVLIGSKISNAKVDPLLAKSGWRVSNLISALASYPVTNDVCRIFVSIGTNGQYSSSDNVEGLISLINSKFPNAEIYLFKGSFGWSGTTASQKESILRSAQANYNPYYQRFEKLGVTILNNGLGYFSTDAQAHSVTSSQAKAIISEINSLTK